MSPIQHGLFYQSQPIYFVALSQICYSLDKYFNTQAHEKDLHSSTCMDNSPSQGSLSSGTKAWPQFSSSKTNKNYNPCRIWRRVLRRSRKLLFRNRILFFDSSPHFWMTLYHLQVYKTRF